MVFKSTWHINGQLHVSQHAGKMAGWWTDKPAGKQVVAVILWQKDAPQPKEKHKRVFRVHNMAQHECWYKVKAGWRVTRVQEFTFCKTDEKMSMGNLGVVHRWLDNQRCCHAHYTKLQKTTKRHEDTRNNREEKRGTLKKTKQKLWRRHKTYWAPASLAH